jgi:hypothetical protein
MTGFVLLKNYTENSESLLRKNRSRVASSSATPPSSEPATHVPSAATTMAQKSLHEFFVPVVANVPIGPAVNVGDKNFELRTRLITMVQANSFCGLPSVDANTHLQHLLELCDTIVIKDVAPDVTRLRLFPFSLMGKAKQWFYKNKEVVSTWNKCSTTFLAKFFPMGKTNALNTFR